MKHAATLARFRIELYSAAQLLKDEELAEFRQLIAEIATILDIKHPVSTAVGSPDPVEVTEEAVDLAEEHAAVAEEAVAMATEKIAAYLETSARKAAAYHVHPGAPGALKVAALDVRSGRWRDEGGGE